MRKKKFYHPVLDVEPTNWQLVNQANGEVLGEYASQWSAEIGALWYVANGESVGFGQPDRDVPLSVCATVGMVGDEPRFLTRFLND